MAAATDAGGQRDGRRSAGDVTAWGRWRGAAMLGRARGPWLGIVAALGCLPSCAEEATATARDATALDADATDLGASDVLVDDLRDATPPTDVPVADVAVDANNGLSIPIDPMGVPAPGSECPGVHPGDPTIAPPRPIVPQSVSRVTSQRPTFRWALPAGTTGARVEVCADRCCTRVIQTLEAEGTTVRPTTALPPGVVYWRMFGRRAGATGSRASYTWEFGVRRRDTPVDSSWGTIRDFTGDGYDDMLLVSSSGFADTTVADLYVVEGSASGPRVAYASGTANIGAATTTKIGDFNGDGLADLAYVDANPSPANKLTVVEGSGGGLRQSRRIDLSARQEALFGGPSVTDWNGDGYSDIVISVYWGNVWGVLGSVLVVYHGSPSGIGDLPQEMFRFGPPVLRHGVFTLSGMEDLDLDGYGDVFADDFERPRRGVGNFILHNDAAGVLRVEEIPAPPTGRGSERYEDVSLPTPVGDLDGDGRSDLVLYPIFSENVLVYRSASGLGMPAYSLRGGATAGVISDEGFGGDVGAGDVNGDGLADLLVSAPGSYSETWMDPVFPFNTGRVYLYWGRPYGIDVDPLWFGRVRPTDPTDNPILFAYHVASPGDINGDGIDDVAVVDLTRRRICFRYGSVLLVSSELSDCVSHDGFDNVVY
ncbi:MAG: hypothetical protein JWM10_76 [Myxococcaceae bacterium]|nr:hypothetical protein [Myxococcaceae bacterium]